jgi:hypothetical protein
LEEIRKKQNEASDLVCKFLNKMEDTHPELVPTPPFQPGLLPQCNFTFRDVNSLFHLQPQREELVKDLTTSSNEEEQKRKNKIFMCSECPLQFAHHFSLKRHTKDKHLHQRDFTCHFCPYAVSERWRLNRHLQTCKYLEQTHRFKIK